MEERNLAQENESGKMLTHKNFLYTDIYIQLSKYV